MESPSSARWYIFYCASRAEKKAAKTLLSSGYEVFLPVIGSLRKWSDRKKWVEQPLFPGYLFVWVTPENISTVTRIPGIVGPLRLALNYGYLLPHEVETIKRMLASGYTVEIVRHEILPGERVMVDDGPLRGLSGICMGEAGDKYLYVQIETLDKAIRAKIPAAALRVL